MKKLQGFCVLKLATERLKNSNYKINISLDEARRNGEVIRLGDSEMLRAILRIKGIKFSQESLDLLLKEKLHLSRKQNNPENRKKIREISEKIDGILFCDLIFVLKVSDVRHYKRAAEQGIIINGVKFFRILSSAGHARRSSAIFAAETIWNELNDFLNCGRKQDKIVGLSKYNAYKALASSASLPVSSPTFVVVPDCVITKKMVVDWFVAHDDNDPTFEERETEQSVNVFDGQGLLSVAQAQVWATDLGIDNYLPSEYLFRAPFAKGLLVVADFHSFARERGITKITDVYGIDHLIDDIECILSESQFKMVEFYDNINEYNVACKENHFSWGISRVSPKQDKDSIGSTYQYIQSLNIKNEEISEICEFTYGWLESVSGLNWKNVLIFLLGELNSFGDNDFKSADYLAKSIMLEPDVLKDQYFRKRLFRFINKKIKEFYIGTLKISGNYEFLICDPIAQCEHALGLPVKGILEKGKAYSKYWNGKKVDRVSVFRSPTTFQSEHFAIDFQLDKSTELWYHYLESGIVVNIYSDWPLRLAGCDFDGDLVLTTTAFVNNHFNNLNIPLYEREKAEKKAIDEKKLWGTDILSFKSKIGLITNFSTTLFSLAPTLTDEKEKEILMSRLKTLNVSQGAEIDRAKGIQSYPVPEWDKWQKDGLDADIHNKLICNRRPYFMKYVYPRYNKKYKHHLNAWDNVCNVRLGFSLETLLSKTDLTETEERIKKEFQERSPLIDSSSTMNLLCHYAESKIKQLKLDSKKTDFDYRIYMSPDIAVDESKLHKIDILYKKFIAYQRNSHDRPQDELDESDDEFPTSDEYIHVLEQEAYHISNNLAELTNLLVTLCYRDHGENSKEFCWRMFNGAGIINNLITRCNGYFNVPVLDSENSEDSFEYLGKKFRLETIVLDTERDW